MAVEAEIKFVERHLVATVDKKELLATMREWRGETKIPAEADVLGELIERVDSGQLDG